MSPCYFLFSQSFPNLFLASATTYRAISQFLPYWKFLTAFFFYFYSSPQCASSCITCRFSFIIRQLFFRPFHLHAMRPSFNLWSQSPNETKGTSRVCLFPASILQSLLVGFLSCSSLPMNWEAWAPLPHSFTGNGTGCDAWFFLCVCVLWYDISALSHF